MAQIKCECGSSDLLLQNNGEDWFIDGKGFIKRKSKITRKVVCKECGTFWDIELNNNQSLKTSKSFLMTELDVSEWNFELDVNKSKKENQERFGVMQNGQMWCILKIWKNNSPIYFANVFGEMAKEFVENRAWEDRDVIYAQIGFNKNKRTINGQTQEEWKQTLLINDEFNGF